MSNKVFKMLLRMVTILLIIGAAGLLISQAVMFLYSRPKTMAAANVPAGQYRVAVVFGAGLARDGSPSAVLRDRVETAANLYFAGKVEKLLMSGDNRFVDYNEPGSMREYAIQLGVPDADIVLDYAGRRTYDTCYRARWIFGLKQAILVTQDFHLPRAVFLCNSLGLPSIGVTAEHHYYHSNPIWSIREIPARAVALWEVLVTHPMPVMGNPEPIFSDQNGQVPTSAHDPSSTPSSK
jgi:SanA protein